MKHIADLITRVVIDKEDPAKIREEVKDFRNNFTEVQYCYR